MRGLIFALFLLLPALAGADEEHDKYVQDICDSVGLYSLVLYGCPQYNPSISTKVPLCEQPEHQELSYLDFRCYQEVPFDWSKPCYEWDCPVPYDHVYVEPITGRRKVYRGDAEEIDQHYRAARAQLGAFVNPPQARTAAPAKKSKHKGRRR